MQIAMYCTLGKLGKVGESLVRILVCNNNIMKIDMFIVHR